MRDHRDTLREKTCCFTGHRELSSEERAALAGAVEQVVRELILEGVCYFGTGGARGFDTLAAQAVLKLREEYPHIKLILVLPCRFQTKGWKAEEKQTYEDILASSDKVRYLAERYTDGCMHKRNRHLVEHSGTCICYLRQADSGTGYTVRYARTSGLRVIEL